MREIEGRSSLETTALRGFKSFKMFQSFETFEREDLPRRHKARREMNEKMLVRDLSASAVPFPSPCTEIALARLATQKPECPRC